MQGTNNSKFFHIKIYVKENEEKIFNLLKPVLIAILLYSLQYKRSVILQLFLLGLAIH